MSISSKLTNAVFFQIVWCTTIFGASQQNYWLAIIGFLVFFAWEIYHTSNHRSLVVLICQVALMGMLIDSFLAYFGLVEYQTPIPFSKLAPIWIIFLWMSFSLTLNQSMAWLENKMLLAAGLGGFFGPLSYWVADTYWDALSLGENQILSLIAIGFFWALAMPLSSFFAFNKHT